MVRLTRPKISQGWLSVLFLFLLLAHSSAFAFFKKPKWLQFSREEVSFWTQLSNDFGIDCDPNNPSVQREILWYQHHPQELQHALKSAEPFIYYVYEQTHRNNLPAELALIPIIESQYNPTVGARSGAAGMWQIMPGTASKFGLKINPSYDGRRDVTASTKAALTYLSYLYHYFHGDWLLALAAYDAGEGRILSLARKHSGGFWNLPVSHETKEYVPKLLAIANIIRHPSLYHLSLPHVPNQATVQEKTWKEAMVMNLSETAKGLGVDDKTFRHLNPGIRQNIANVPHSLTLLVPENNASIEIPEETQSSVAPTHKTSKQKKYKIRKGDTLTIIAKKFHISVKDLKRTNHLSEKQLSIGHTVVIPN